MIDQATVDKIIDRANILEVVSDFVTLRKRGVNYIGLCPFHDEKTPSFSVSPAKGICKCFSCGKGGSPLYFIMEHEQLSYYEALKYLAKKYNIEVQERELSDDERRARNDRESMLIINNFAQEYFSSTLFNHLEGKSIGLSYFRERGFRDDIIRKFGLGYALDQRDALSVEAKKRAYNPSFLLKTGLCLEGQNGYMTDRFRGRVIFPIYSLSGKVLGFGGRILKKDDKMAKYVNSPESEIYHKSNELYGLFQAKQSIVKNDTCFLVEGYTDVLSMHQAGIENVVASSGTALTPGQIRLIHRFTNNITVIYDGDAAGIKASIRGIDLILKEGMNIKVVLLPDGDDPDSFAKKQSATSFIQYIQAHETDFIRFKTQLLLQSAANDPIKRAELIGDLVQSIAIIPSAIIRTVYITECSSLLEVSERVLINEINKIKLDQTSQPVRNTNTTEVLVAQAEPEATVSTVNPQIPTTSVEHLDPSLIPLEKELIRLIIRYTDFQLPTGEVDEKGDPIQCSLIHYIHEELLNDEISLQNGLYRLILHESIDRLAKGLPCNERYFLTHPNPQIAELATELISEKYQLSAYHSRYQEIATEESQLVELVPRAVLDYKYALIKIQIMELNKEIKRYSKEKNAVKVTELMREIQELNAVYAEFAKAAGERIVRPR